MKLLIMQFCPVFRYFLHINGKKLLVSCIYIAKVVVKCLTKWKRSYTVQ